MKSKWLTLLFVSSLGPMVWLCPSSGALVLAGDDAPVALELATTDVRRRALVLLRQATAELQANRFDAARSLAKQAADLNATYSLFDVRPEHVLAEIERKERTGATYAKTPAPVSEHPVAPAQKPATGLVAVAPETNDPFALPIEADTSKTGEVSKAQDLAPALETSKTNASGFPAPLVPIPQAAVEQASVASAAPSPADRLKARAIEMLDRGLQALDEWRLDDAERYARAAQSLHASFGKLEYKPDYLITEIGIARAQQRLDAVTSQSGSQPAETKGSPGRATQRPAAAAGNVQPVGAAATSAQPHVAAQPVVNSAGAMSSHERAERLLQEALVDLHAGRDDVARARIEGALGVIHPSTSSSLPMFQAANPATAKPGVAMPSAPSTADLPQSRMPQMPRAGFPSYVPDPTLDAHDVALKPLHDPYFGDEPNSTQKSTAGENSLRETLPTYAPINSSLSLNRPLPRMTNELPQYPVDVSNAPSAPSGVSQAQTVSAAQNQSARVRWPESDSAAAVPQAATAPASQQSAAAPQFDGRAPSTARYTYAPITMKSWTPESSEEQPGYFHRLWNALIGE